MLYLQGRPVRLLLIDDDQVDRIAVRRALQASGVRSELEEVSDFESAAAALQRNTADCVLLDFDLPSGNGRELLQLARSPAIDLPTIVLTGRGDEALAVELMKAGAADYLPKKLLSPELLRQSIRQALRVNQAERRAKAAQVALAKQATQLKTLADTTLGLHAAVTLDETLAVAAQLSRELCQARVAIAHSFHPPRPPLRARSVASGPDPLTAEQAAAWDEAVRKSAQMVLRASDDPSDWRAGAQLKNLLAVPMFGRAREPIGSLVLLDRLEGEFDTVDALILNQVARAAVVSLENSRLYHEAQEAVRVRDDVLAAVSHDLRSPLSVVSLGADRLKLALEGTEEAAVVTRIERGVRRMTRLIDDLLDVASIDAGQLSVRPKPLSATVLVQDAFESASLLAQETGCGLSAAELDSSLTVLADPERIAQLLGNVIGNALKFVPAGKGVVVLGLRRDGQRACFSVRDNGAGIAPEHVPHVFTRHYRGVDSAQGHGLGLYICRGIVDAHHGDIAIESTVGQGTVVRFWLPLVR